MQSVFDVMLHLLNRAFVGIVLAQGLGIQNTVFVVHDFVAPVRHFWHVYLVHLFKVTDELHCVCQRIHQLYPVRQTHLCEWSGSGKLHQLPLGLLVFIKFFVCLQSEQIDCLLDVYDKSHDRLPFLTRHVEWNLFERSDDRSDCRCAFFDAFHLVALTF